MIITAAGILLSILLFFVILIAFYSDMPREELEKKYAPLPSKFVEIDGTRVHYRDEGRGPALHRQQSEAPLRRRELRS